MPVCGATAYDQDGELHRCHIPTENRDPRFIHQHYCEACDMNWQDSDVKDGKFYSPWLDWYGGSAIPFYEKGHLAGKKKEPIPPKTDMREGQIQVLRKWLNGD